MNLPLHPNAPRQPPPAKRFAMPSLGFSAEGFKHGSIGIFFLMMSLSVIAMLSAGRSVPTIAAGVIHEKPRCSMWNSGILTCSLHNPADEPSNVAVLVTVTCTGKNAADTYRETIIAEQVPERGWAPVVINSDGYTLFYKGVANALKSHSEQLIRVAMAGGLTVADMTPKQQAQIAREVFDVCKLEVGAPVLTLTARTKNVDFVAALKTLWGN